MDCFRVASLASVGFEPSAAHLADRPFSPERAGCRSAVGPTGNPRSVDVAPTASWLHYRMLADLAGVPSAASARPGGLMLICTSGIRAIPSRPGRLPHCATTRGLKIRPLRRFVRVALRGLHLAYFDRRD